MFHTGSTVQNWYVVHAGYSSSDPMTYQLLLPKDHPDGERPVEIFDKSKALRKFEKALKLDSKLREIPGWNHRINHQSPLLGRIKIRHPSPDGLHVSFNIIHCRRKIYDGCA